MNVYDLSRDFWDFAFENPDKIKPNHCAVYFFSIEHCNRLGWKKKFGFPTTMVMDAIGIKSYNTYISTLNDLVDFGFIEMIEKSKNQYSANIIAISKFNKALDKALDKALIKHGAKQSTKQVESIHSVDKQINNSTNKQIYNIVDRKLKFASTLKPFVEIYGKQMLNEFYAYWTEPNKSNTKFKQELEKTWSLDRRLETWAKNDRNFKKSGNGTTKQNADEAMEATKRRILGEDYDDGQPKSSNQDFEFTSYEDVGSI